MGWLINGGHGLIIEIFAHVFCAISQLRSLIIHTMELVSNFRWNLNFWNFWIFFSSKLSDRQQPETEKRDAVGQQKFPAYAEENLAR